MATPVPRALVQLVRAQHAALRRIEPEHQQRLYGWTKRLQADVEARLKTLPQDRYTAQSERVILAQLRVATAAWQDGIEGELRDVGEVAAEIGRSGLGLEIAAWEQHFKGTIRRTAPIEEAGDVLRPGLLERYESSVNRYGLEQIQQFRDIMAEDILEGRTVVQTWERLAADAGFSEGRAERIVRTETSHAFHQTQMDDMVHMFGDDAADWEKELVTTFDGRTGDDSKYVHGQRRKLTEDFKDNEGREYDAPPNRPNDRETMVMVPPEGAIEQVGPVPEREAARREEAARRRAGVAPEPAPTQPTVSVVEAAAAALELL